MATKSYGTTGREGVGALRFLRLLGAETAPRPRLHPRLEQRYADHRRGLPASVMGSPEARGRAMQERGATYTLQDYDNPDLLAVVEDIAHERRGKQRRRRTGALLATLGRAWDRLLSEFAEVSSANDYHGWEEKGRVRAYWRWLAVVPRDVVYRREEGVAPADAAVWTPVIVIRKEPRQRVEPLAVGVVRSLVGPLGLHDLVERLRLPVGLRPERPRALQPQVLGLRRAGEVRLTYQAPLSVRMRSTAMLWRSKWVRARTRKAAAVAPRSSGRAST